MAEDEIQITTDELVPVLQQRLQQRDFECAVLQARISQLEKTLAEVIESEGGGLRIIGESEEGPEANPQAAAE